MLNLHNMGGGNMVHTKSLTSCNGPRAGPRYHQKASEAGCWVVCDAQSGFRKKGQRSEDIDSDELRKLIQAAYEWGCEIKPSEIEPGKEGY